MAGNAGADEATTGTAAAKGTTETAIFASGCFWGTEDMFRKLDGIVSMRVGYTGGKVPNPTYKQVCTGMTGHAEALEVVFDPARVSYETLAKYFFETHDPTQANGQGPDIGEQYRSVIYTTNPEQKRIAESLIAQLKAKGLDVVTQVVPATVFWPAEDYHQRYYQRTGGTPYCHRYTKRF